MAKDFVKIQIAGEELNALYNDLSSIQIEHSETMTSIFRIVVNLARGETGWRMLDNQALKPWQEITIVAGLEEDNEEMIKGYITQIKISFGDSPQQAYMEIWGMDRSIAMDRAEVLKDWPDKTDSDIVAEIFAKYGLDSDVEATSVVHSADVSTIIQRETDWRFIKRLALRNGFECYVQGDVGYFKPVSLDSNSQGILAVHFAEDTNAYGFKLAVDGLSTAKVGMFQIDRINKETLDLNIDASSYEPLGAIDAMALVGDKTIPADGTALGQGQIYLGQNNAFGVAEMETTCQGLMDSSTWLVNGEINVDTAAYGKLIQPRKRITVKGAGEIHSGEYYVSHVMHHIGKEGMKQKVQIKRNAIGLTGNESFDDSNGLGLPF